MVSRESVHNWPRGCQVVDLEHAGSDEFFVVVLPIDVARFRSKRLEIINLLNFNKTIQK